MTHVRSQRAIIATLVLVAVNLRPALTSVPVLLDDIKASTGWSDATLGLLTTVPVLCMGIVTLLVATIASHVGRRRTVAAALAILTLALALRWWAEFSGALWLSVFLAGIGIALALGLVPGIVREQLPQAVGRATGWWTAAMMTGAALASALTVPLSHALGSWTKALACWAIVAAMALVGWIIIEGLRKDTDSVAVRLRHLPWRHPSAWALTGYLMVNSFVFYVLVAWLAPSFIERGWSPSAAGWLVGVFAITQIFAALIVTPAVTRAARRRTAFTAICVAMAITTLAIGLVPVSLPALVLILAGLCGALVSANYTVGIALLSEYGASPMGSARLSAMVLGCTYIVAAFGPWLAGAFLDMTKAFPWLFALAALIALAQLVAVPRLRRGVTID